MLKNYYSLKDINITGEIGDQLFGSAAFFDALESGQTF